jgi:broad specificity phosphatase PhoE
MFKYSDKVKLKKDIFKTLNKIKDVVSVTLVGSFWENKSTNDFSDIDIVIILKKFNKVKYDQCLKRINNLKLEKYNLKHLKTLINPTFGPLKFNTKNNIVFHIMIYDVKSHFNHVIRSPFTCFDWERSSNYSGKSLKEIFPVGKIQLEDFFKSRRGVISYLDDLNKNHISYQKYIFQNDFYKIIKKRFKINDIHKIEFSFHLCKFLIINLYKFENQKNKIPNKNEIKMIFKKIFNRDYSFYYNNFLNLKILKEKQNTKLNFNNLSFIKKFTNKFQKYLKNYKKQEIIFLRHGKTKYNDGTFLGIGRNPSIINKKIVFQKLNFLKNKKSKTVYSSSLTRSIETAETFEKMKNIKITKLLVEKNYGLAEGLNFLQFTKKYPSIIKNWNKKKDSKFPSGENDDDILKRLKLFQKLLIRNAKNSSKSSIYVIVTHNALLRCLIGNIFNIPKYLWVKIQIKHLDPLNFIIKKNKIIPNIHRVNLFNDLIN